MLDSWLCSVLRSAPYTCSTVWTGAGPAAARQHARLSVSEDPHLALRTPTRSHARAWRQAEAVDRRASEGHQLRRRRLLAAFTPGLKEAQKARHCASAATSKALLRAVTLASVQAARAVLRPRAPWASRQRHATHVRRKGARLGGSTMLCRQVERLRTHAAGTVRRHRAGDVTSARSCVQVNDVFGRPRAAPPFHFIAAQQPFRCNDAPLGVANREQRAMWRASSQTEARVLLGCITT
jgi:hypothetical protein